MQMPFSSTSSKLWRSAFTQVMFPSKPDLSKQSKSGHTFFLKSSLIKETLRKNKIYQSVCFAIGRIQMLQHPSLVSLVLWLFRCLRQSTKSFHKLVSASRTLRVISQTGKNTRRKMRKKGFMKTRRKAHHLQVK